MSNGIRYDPLLVSHLARELERTVGGQDARAVHFDPESRTVLLFLESRTLVAELHPLRGALRLQPAWDVLGGAVPLRGRLQTVSAPPDERILRLRTGDRKPRFTLVFELMTNQMNALLLKEPGARIREVVWRRSPGERELRPGPSYDPPPPSRRRGAREPLPREAWLELLLPVEGDERIPTLLRNVAYTSRINARWILGGAAEAGGGGRGPRDREALDAAWRRWRELRGRDEADPCVLEPETGPQPYPFPLDGVPHREAPTLLAAMDRALEGGTDEGAAGLPEAVLERIDAEAEAARSRRARLEEELARAPDPAEIREKGNLLLARLGEVDRGAGTAVLEGFDGETVELELDPTLEPAENADRYYREAARAERARERLPGLIRRAREEEETLRDALRRGREGTLDLSEARELLPDPPDEEDEDAGPGTALPYRRFLTSGGNEVRVGRGAKQNEDLTFHHSSPEDIWLHARHAAGAHVILRWDRDGNPPERELAEAGVLAALHSEARHSGTVPVDWTRRKYVRSPRKSPPGVVVPDRVKTVFVEPDAAVEKRMAAAWAKKRREDRRRSRE